MDTINLLKNKSGMNAIDRILASREAAKQQIEMKAKSVTKVISAENFFSDDNENGLVSKEDYLKVIESMSSNQLEHLSIFFQQLTDKVRLVIPLLPSLFELNERYYYKIGLNSKTVKRDYNLRQEPFIDELIKIYTFELADFDLNFDELYELATSLDESDDLVLKD